VAKGIKILVVWVAVGCFIKEGCSPGRTEVILYLQSLFAHLPPLSRHLHIVVIIKSIKK